MEGCQDQEGEGSCREGARVNECLNKSIAETSLGADEDEEVAEEEEFDDPLNKGGGPLKTRMRRTIPVPCWRPGKERDWVIRARSRPECHQSRKKNVM